jgi:[ribosomal protein S18]-alanine N-acetyltransferase
MSPSLVLRPAGIGDLALLATLMEASFPADSGERWRPEDLAVSLSLSGVFGILANADDVPAGFALTRTVADEAELLLIGVAPTHRRIGLGTRLLEQVAEGARAMGAHMLFLEMRIGNHEARALYSQRGFDLVGTRKAYYRTGTRVEDAITMRKNLLS